ncbi:MAG: glucosylceramidase, partial [Ginsengibacter sp.]
MFSEIKYWSIIICVGLISASCTKKIVPADNPVPVDTTGSVTSAGIEYWLTTPDQASLLAKQPNKLMFSSSASSGQVIKTDTTKKYQAVDGFGYSLTGGSAYVINRLPLSVKSDLLKELFGKSDNGISISYLRISIGASDLDADVFSYDDLPPGQTDESLDHFTLDPDRQDLVPLLKEILAINPSIKILGSPWSPPVWMKDNDSSKGGSLLPKYYDAYARYFVKYILHMKTEGINIDAITPQNEPLNPKNNPSLIMLAEQERDFIKNNLGPAFAAAG